jgi:nucleoside-diphosphate-sugar epimerase
MKILLIGGTGYVGKAIKNELNKIGLSVISIGTSTNPNFIIGEEVDENIFTNIDYVLYLSWNFDTRDKEYSKKNIESFQKVNNICRKNKIKLFFISTLLASSDSKSKYNKTKAACENIAIKSGFSVLRLGTVLLEGYDLTGTYGKISNFVSKYKIYPRIHPNKAVFEKTDIKNIKEICLSLNSL